MTLRRALLTVASGLTLALALFTQSQAATTLLVHAGAGIRPALDDAATAFTKKTGVKIDYNYKGSGCLLPDVLMSGKGDVYIPGEDYYLKQALQRKLIQPGAKIVASMTTVIIAGPGNPKGIRTLQDLAKPGVRFGLGDPKVVACGRAGQEALTKAKAWSAAQKNQVMSAQNVSELSNAVRLGNLDAAIVWNATAAMYSAQNLTTVPVPAKFAVTSKVPVGVVAKSSHPREAQQFADFLASPEGRQIFLKHGFGVPAAAPAKAKPRGKA